MAHPITIGFISTWPIYQGMTIDRYAHALIQGISAAARSKGCRLLLGCGFDIGGNNPQQRSFWPAPGPNVNFVPVGPWNTDGLIIVPDELNEAQQRYVHDLLSAGFPLVFTTPEGPGPLVKVDNTLGIRQAFAHLLEHGHYRIAFIAGNPNKRGDSGERLRAYLEALHEAGLPFDEKLIAFGEHRREGGQAAMRQILERKAPFTALIASNDLSCLGAIEVLRTYGYRIPEDVAVIGFDDILDARALSPSLTTVRHPTFSLGYEAVITLLEYIQGVRKEKVQKVVPTRLIVRESCGCCRSLFLSPPLTSPIELIRESAEIAFTEARNCSPEELECWVRMLIERLIESVRRHDSISLLEEIRRCLSWSLERNEDVHLWQAALSAIRYQINTILAQIPDADGAFAIHLLDQVQFEIGGEIQRQAARSLLMHQEMMAQLGFLTTEMLSAMNLEQTADILSRHLPRVGINSAVVVLYEDEEEPTSRGKVLLGAGFSVPYTNIHFDPRQFPIPQIYPPEQPLQLIILPLDVDEQNSGFVAFEAANPELCAAIVYNLAAALRTSRLYHEAIEGRRLAEEADRLKSRFLSMVSHELRTPLSLIVGLSEMMLRSEKTEKRDIEQIYINAEHLARLIGDVLDMASSEAGQLRILYEPLDLSDVLRVTAKIGEQLAASKGLSWQATLPERGPWVVGDRVRLRQITLNLIDNAVKFTSSGEVRMDVAVQDGQAVVSVSDTGPGISPDELQTIFTEFYRSVYATASGISGIGLGLAITRELIDRHGGDIKVCSPGILGRGATFTFTLPILSTEALPPESIFPPVKSDTAERNRRISPGTPIQTVLVVDDDPGVLELYSHLVEQAGHRPITAHNGREALKILEHTRPALILLDLWMPEMDGFALLEIIHERERTCDIPIIILTGRTLSDTEMERCHRSVANILGKGLFSTEEILHHIEATLERRNRLGIATRQLVRRAMAYIHTHYADPITREEIAAAIGISPDYLSDCFRQELGITPPTYIRRYRIRQACELLRNTDQSITQIAQSVGFSDNAHFTRSFQREMGMSPKTYRRKL
jgi:signal transduction histidine kinase/DNA-binding LacI/PurR family transcriptional regulator/AraC-like DNA-binding protein